MKIRTDFVTNSSSSNFAVVKMNNKDILKKIEDTGFEEIILDVIESDAEMKLVWQIECKYGDKFKFTEDFDMLSEAYISLLESEFDIKAEKKDVLVEAYEESWGEYLDYIAEEFGIVCHHSFIETKWIDKEGIHQSHFRLELYETPEDLLEADSDVHDKIISGEETIGKYVEELKNYVSDIKPILVAFVRGLKQEGLDVEELKKIFSDYFHYIENEAGLK